jgi:branched-chain amino acid aminotransferase
LALGYLDQVSVFETLRVYQKKIFHFREHFKRLSESCLAIGKSIPFSENELHYWLDKVIVESGFDGALLRASLHWPDKGPGMAVALVREFEEYPRRWYENGVEMNTTVSRRWTLKAQDPQIKASQFVSGVLAVLDQKNPAPLRSRAGKYGSGSQKGGAYELLFLGQGGTVAEGSVSNVFIIKSKCVLTPSVASGILKGVTRSVVIDLAGKKGLEITETCLTRHDIYTADECFMTNTSSEVLPVVRVDGREIGNGKPGAVTRLLAGEFKKEIKRFLAEK